MSRQEIDEISAAPARPRAHALAVRPSLLFLIYLRRSPHIPELAILLKGISPYLLPSQR